MNFSQMALANSMKFALWYAVRGSELFTRSHEAMSAGVQPEKIFTKPNYENELIKKNSSVPYIEA